MTESHIVDNREDNAGLSLFCGRCNKYQSIMTEVSIVTRYYYDSLDELTKQVSGTPEMTYHCQNCEQDISYLLSDEQKQWLETDREII